MPRDSRETIERDFLAALNRLLEGKPHHPKLKSRLKQGTLEINPSTVSLEAGRARTLIALNDCEFPLVRAEVVKHKRPYVPNTSLRAINANIRQDKARIDMDLKAARTQITAHFKARLKAEREVVRWKQKYEALKSEPQGNKVVKLPGTAR